MNVSLTTPYVPGLVDYYVPASLKLLVNPPLMVRLKGLVYMGGFEGKLYSVLWLPIVEMLD